MIHPHAVEIAMKGHTPLRVRSTFHDGVGTLVTQHVPTNRTNDDSREHLVTAIAHSPHLTQIKVSAQEDIPILQSADSHTTIWVLVREKDMVKAVKALHQCFQLHLKGVSNGLV